MVKKLFLFIIILFSIELYNLTFLGDSVSMLNMVGIVLLIPIIILHGVYDDSVRFKSGFTFFIILILISVPTSIYIAMTQHNQSIGLSILGERHIFYYLAYFAFHAIKARPKDIVRLFMVFGILFIALYLIQTLLYPFKLFNTRMFYDRGTLRIFLSGMSLMVVVYFYTLQKFLELNKFKYLFFNLLALSVMVLIGSRSLLFVVLLVTIINLILSKRIKSRVLIYILSIAGLVVIFFLFQSIFTQLLEASKETKDSGASNIRIKAIRFYFRNMFPNGLSYIFGNGVGSRSSDLAQRMTEYSTNYGYFLSDIGIIGNYINYGAFFVIGVIGLIIKVLVTKIQESFMFLKYFILSLFLTLPTGGGFTGSELIVLACLCMYLIDVSAHLKKNEEDKPIEHTEETISYE